MILRKKQVHFLCVLRTQGYHVYTLVTKTKALHYNQHKIVTFDTFIIIIKSFSLWGKLGLYLTILHLKLMEIILMLHSKLHSKLSWKTAILHPSMIMCYQRFYMYSLISCKAKSPSWPPKSMHTQMNDKGEGVFYVSELFIDTGTWYWSRNCMIVP